MALPGHADNGGDNCGDDLTLIVDGDVAYVGVVVLETSVRCICGTGLLQYIMLRWERLCLEGAFVIGGVSACICNLSTRAMHSNLRVGEGGLYELTC